MQNKRKAKPTSSAVILAIAVSEHLYSGGIEFTVDISRPGRDGTFIRTWSNPGGALDSAQAEDLCAYVQRSAMNALLVWHGVQGVIGE